MKLLQIITELFKRLFCKKSAKNDVIPQKEPVLFQKPARNVNKVFLHCSASDSTQYGLEEIRKDHIQRGFTDIGYHFVILRDGTICKGRNLELIPASQKRHNLNSISICVCGLSKFTNCSLEALVGLCTEIHLAYGEIRFRGHNEVDKNRECPVYPYREILNLDEGGFMGIV